MMRSGAQQPQQQGSLEETMAAVFEARDQLIERFAAVATDRAAGQVLAASIQKIEGQLRAMGASFEPFDPVKLSSGLRTPPTQSCSLDNAKRVAATTSQCYAAHPINKILAGKTKDGRPGVLVVIAGVHNSQRFAVEGRVVPRKGPDFVGNEVIDYVKDAGKGIMSVKVPGQGRWMDVTGDYEVAWRLVS